MVLETLIMGDHEQGSAGICGLFSEQIQDDLGIGVVEGTCGFIGQNQAWFVHHGACNGNPLLFSHRQFVDSGIEFVSKPKAVEQTFDSAGVGRLASQSAGQREVFCHIQTPHEMGRLENDAHVLSPGEVSLGHRQFAKGLVVQFHVARGGSSHPRHQVKQCCFSSSRCTQEQEFLSPVQLNVRKGHLGPFSSIVVSQSLRSEHKGESYDGNAPIFAA